MRYAISNRYYDGLIYHIPQLVEVDGFKASVTTKNGIGIALEANDEFADKLFDYYNSIEDKVFDKMCNKTLQEVLLEDDEYIRKIDEYIRKIG